MVGSRRSGKRDNPPPSPRMSVSRTGRGFFRPWRIPEGASETVAVDRRLRNTTRNDDGRENDDEDSVVSSISTASTTSAATSATTSGGTDRLLLSRDAAIESSLVDVLHHKNVRRGSESSDDCANSSPPSLQGEETTSSAVPDATYDSSCLRDALHPRQTADGYPSTASTWIGTDDIGAFRDVCTLGYYTEFGFPRSEELALAPMNGAVYSASLATHPDAAVSPSSLVSAGMTPGFILSLTGLRPVIHRVAHPEVHRAIQSGIYPGSILPSGFYNRTMEEAAELVHRQDAAVKQMKKMRPKKFRCQHCDMAFSNNGQLKGHVRIHTGERPFKCDVESCGKSFTRNEELTRHKRIHTGVRPHSCVVCGKRFGRKDHLKKHTRTHEVRDPYRVSAAALGMLALGHPFQQSAELPPYVYQL